MQLNTGDNVKWSSAAGNINGVITNICLNLNAAKQIVPWIDIEVIDKKGRAHSVRLCGTNQNLIMMRVAKI